MKNLLPFDASMPVTTFESMLNNLPGMAYRCQNDSDWTMTWVSAGVRDLTGYSPEEILHNRLLSYASLIHPEDVESVAEEVVRSSAAKERFQLSYRILHKDGQLKWVWEQCQAIYGEHGLIVGFEGYITDVSPLVQARRERDELVGKEQAARAEATLARAHFRSLFEEAPGQFLVLSVPDFVIVAASNAYLHVTGRSRKELIGQPLFQAFPGDPNDTSSAEGVENLKASFERVLAFRTQDVMVVQRYPIPAPNGGFVERFWSPVNVPVIGEDGRTHYIIHKVEDVTDYIQSRRLQGPDRLSFVLGAEQAKEAEVFRRAQELIRLNESLRHSEAMFRGVFDEAPVGIAVVHPDGTLALANASYRRMLGIEGNRTIGQPFTDWIKLQDREAVAVRDAQVLSGQHSGYEDEECYVTSDGRETWVRARVSALHGFSGTVSSLVRVAQDITEQKRLASQLRQRDSLVRIAGRLALVGGWAVDVDSGEFECSSEVHRIMGREDGQPMPSIEDFMLLHPAKWRKPLRDALKCCMENARPYSFDVELITPMGQHKWVTVAGEPELDSSGSVRRVVGIVQDITARRHAEQERDEVAARLHTTLDSMSDAFYLLDHDWRFVFVNRQAEKLLNRSAQGLIGQVLWKEFPQAATTPEFAAYRDAMTDGRTRTFEVWYAPLHNWFEISAQPSTEGLAVYFRPITERKQLQAQLAASEERFRYVAEATTDAVWDWDLQTDQVWWNDAVHTLFGFNIDEMEPDSTSWTSRIHPDDVGRITSSIHEVIDSGQVHWKGEYRFRCKDGRYARIVDRGFVVRDAEGQPCRMVGGMIDMTERLVLEEQLRQSQRLETVGQLTGGMAHDFNNLLTVILGNAEILAEEMSSLPRGKALAEMIVQAAQRGSELTSRLLAFARKQALAPQIVNPNRVLTEMDGLLRRTLGEHIEINVVLSAGLWSAMVDPAQLESATLNLCLNARDAMPQGGRLTIETANVRLDAEYTSQHPDVQPGDYVMVAVSDTGYGIESGLLERVFEPFFTTKEPGKGTGLGLSMVYGFLKQSRGHVSIYSEIGQGTTVKLYLPKAAGEEPEVSKRGESLNSGTGIILLVEDDALVRGYTHMQLTSLGYQVIEACNAGEALDVLRSPQELDLLFTDVVMPGGMNGKQLAVEAKNLRPELPVLFVSGYTDNAIVHHGRLDPGVQLLTKPYFKADLAQRVAQAIGSDSLGDQRA